MNRHQVAFLSDFIYYKHDSTTNAETDVRLQQATIPIIVFIVSYSLGCDESVNLSAPFVPSMAVYSVLTTQSDTQFVRVYTSYNPTDNNPQNNLEEAPVTDAVVSISDGITTYTFRDTTIQRPDTSRYKNSIRLYYCYPFRAESNMQYTLSVNSESHGLATASISVPSLGQMAAPPEQVLNDPIRFGTIPIEVECTPTQSTTAYLIRLYLVYTDENSWEQEAIRGREKYFEVPTLRIAIDRLTEECTIQYPPIKKLGPVISSNRRGQPPQLLGFTFPLLGYLESIARITRSNFNVRFRRAIFYYVQFDEPWYKHYASTNLFQDKLGVRLDNPQYSNINGGVGLFAGIRIDSTVVQLNETIPYLNRFTGDDGYVYCQQEAPPSTEPLGELRKLMFRP